MEGKLALYPWHTKIHSALPKEFHSKSRGLFTTVECGAGLAPADSTLGTIAKDISEILYGDSNQIKSPLESPVQGFSGKRKSFKRSERVWKPKRTKRSMVLGMDIRLKDSCSLAMCALVGRLAYCLLCKLSVSEWM